MLGFRKRTARLNLALQGGGAHGAFTWGVLDHLLGETDIEPGWISGTSAGAINAVAMVSGMATGGRQGARETLRAVWEAVLEAGVPDLLRLNPFFSSFSRSPTLGQIGQLFSPYDFNPLGFDPLRKLLEAQIDFAKVRAHGDIELLIAATDVATGRARLFRRNELTVEAVLASTCLPMLHHAVEIGGRAYWDGGYTANPDIVSLASQSPVGDTLIVQLNARERAGVARTAREITSEVNRVVFTQSLLRDVAEIVRAQELAQSRWRSPRTAMEKLAVHRFHLIEAGGYTDSLPPESKMRPERALVTALHAAGHTEAGNWLERSRQDVGRRSSVDLATHFLGAMAPLRLPAADTKAMQQQDAEAIAEKL